MSKVADDEHDVELLHSLVRRHAVETGSQRAAEVLASWDRYLPLFTKVHPKPTVAPAAPRDLLRQRRDAMLAAMRAKHGEGV
jgi:glutamate synthase domain-containing protein 3